MTRRLRALFAPPSPETRPQDALRWVRQIEITAGIIGIAAAVVVDGWLRWLLIACALLSLSPWPGAQAILHRAKKNPSVLEADRSVGWHRSRRWLLALIPLYTVGGAAVGYLVAGSMGALVTAGVSGLSAALGGWWVLRRLRPR